MNSALDRKSAPPVDLFLRSDRTFAFHGANAAAAAVVVAGITGLHLVLLPSRGPPRSGSPQRFHGGPVDAGYRNTSSLAYEVSRYSFVKNGPVRVSTAIRMAFPKPFKSRSWRQVIDDVLLMLWQHFQKLAFNFRWRQAMQQEGRQYARD